MRLSPDAASRLAFHREPSAGARNILQDFVSTALQGREHVRKAKRLAAYINGATTARLHILQRYLHRCNRYLLARSVSPDPRHLHDQILNSSTTGSNTELYSAKRFCRSRPKIPSEAKVQRGE